MPRQSVYQQSIRYFLEPVCEYLDDPDVTEVMVNGHQQIYIERQGRIESTLARFESEDAIRSAINNLAQSVGRNVGPESPILDARLPDGSPVHAIIPPSSRGGTYLTIRKFSREPLTMDDLVNLGSLSAAAQEFLEICVRLRKNIIVSGGSGTGKTSLVGALSRAIPEEERIIVIEDTTELRLHQQHCLYLEAQPRTESQHAAPDIRELFRASLRMRPDRIIVGEVRGGEALDLIQAMISGHDGSLSTVHASTPRDALIRLETLSLMSDVQIPVYVARAQVASAVNLIVQLARSSVDGRRIVTSIHEACQLDAQNQYQLTELFSLRRVSSDAERSFALLATGNQPTFANQPAIEGMGFDIDLSRELWMKDES